MPPMDIARPDLARRKRRRRAALAVAVELILAVAFSLNFILYSHMKTDSIDSMNIPMLFLRSKEGLA